MHKKILLLGSGELGKELVITLKRLGQTVIAVDSYAGAPAIVASLWKVDDNATAMLMTAFYGHLKRGLGPAAALRAAQAETRARHPDPFHWAAFVLTGEPR